MSQQIPPALTRRCCLALSVQPQRPETPDQQGGAKVVTDAYWQCFGWKQGKRRWYPEVSRVADAASQLEIRLAQSGDACTQPAQDHQHQPDGGN